MDKVEIELRGFAKCNIRIISSTLLCRKYCKKKIIVNTKLNDISQIAGNKPYCKSLKYGVNIIYRNYGTAMDSAI